jgi:hypothetical protein
MALAKKKAAPAKAKVTHEPVETGKRRGLDDIAG